MSAALFAIIQAVIVLLSVFLGYRIGAQRTKRHFICLIAKRLSQRTVSQGD